MPTRLTDRVKETTTTVGTGDITLLGAVAQFQSFIAKWAVGETIAYAIVGQSGTEWEVGTGTFSSSTVLARTTVIDSSNAGALVNFSAGTKDVFNSLTSRRINRTPTYGQAIAAAAGYQLQ